jgi:hypothetical protein
MPKTVITADRSACLGRAQLLHHADIPPALPEKSRHRLVGQGRRLPGLTPNTGSTVAAPPAIPFHDLSI